jgi:hypothetical protein
MLALAVTAQLLWRVPARADNCSGLSDCSAGVKIALAVGAVLLAILAIWFIAELVEAAEVEEALRRARSAAKAIRSLKRQIEKHQEKLAKFRSNPTVRPGMENLSKEVIEAAQQRRIEHLEREIRAFQDAIEKIERGDW